MKNEDTLTTPLTPTPEDDILKETSISDNTTLNTTLNTEGSGIFDYFNNLTILEDEIQMHFKDKAEIILYTALNKTNARLLKEGKYTWLIEAFEYSEAVKGVNQAEIIVELSYDTSGLFDTLHFKAYNIIERLIKEKKLKKSELTDEQLISTILKNTKYTGVRASIIDTNQKAFPKTQCIFKSKGLRYFLNPKAVKFIAAHPIKQQ